MVVAAVAGLMPWIASQAAAKPLKVFILAGQSNMVGHVNVSTFPSMANDPKTAPILKEMTNADGKPRVLKKVWISSARCAPSGCSTLVEHNGRLTAGYGATPSDIGPEFPFGIYMEKLVGGPILIIKTAWGGKDVVCDFRPPSAGPYVVTKFEAAQLKKRGIDPAKYQAKKRKMSGVYYRLMIGYVKRVLANIKQVDPDYNPKQGYKLDGFVWFQGWNDLVDHTRYPSTNYTEYGKLMAMFIRDVRKDLSAPKMPFVIGVLGVHGEKAGPLWEKGPSMLAFRKAEVAPTLLPEFRGNVVAVQTAPFWNYHLAALRTKLRKVNMKLNQEFKKDPKLSQAARAEARKKAMAENFTPEELKQLKATSNWDYHYLGAAKIVAPIGKAFAEAMAKLQTTQSQ